MHSTFLSYNRTYATINKNGDKKKILKFLQLGDFVMLDLLLCDKFHLRLNKNKKKIHINQTRRFYEIQILGTSYKSNYFFCLENIQPGWSRALIKAS